MGDAKIEFLTHYFIHGMFGVFTSFAVCFFFKCGCNSKILAGACQVLQKSCIFGESGTGSTSKVESAT